jgi:phage shock protein C
MVPSGAPPYGSVMTDLDHLRDDPPSPDDGPHVDSARDVDPRVRLRRRRDRRVIAGVAGGLSDRFEIDPNIIRVIFVVLSLLWGLGAAIYLAMWALVPRAPTHGDDSTSPPEPTRSWLMFSLLLGLVVFGLIFVAVTVGLPRFGGGLVVVWLVFLAGVSVVSIRVASPRFTFQRFLALGVLSTLTVVIVLSGSFLAFLAATNVPLSGGDGQHSWQPTSLSSVVSTYRTEFGEETVDLSSVVFPSHGFDVTASVAAGNLTVYVPMDAIVNLRTHIGIGTVSYNDFGAPGGFDPLPKGSTTASERAAAPHLTLSADVGVGQILVEREPPASPLS